MKKKRRLKKKYVIFLSLYFIVFISHFTIVTFAKYTSFLNREGNLSVAKWDIDFVGADNQVLPTMTIGKSSTYQNYNLSITSTSEIAINYSIVISDVPTGVRVQVDDDTIYNERYNEIIIPDLGSFDADDNNVTHNHKLTLIVPLGIDTIDNQVLNMDVIFTQIEL